MKHPDDGALLRFLDTELSENERDAMQDHMGSCASCNARLDEIRATMKSVANALARADMSAHAWNKVSWTRVVAVAASVLLVVAVCLTPVSAWVVEQVRMAWHPAETADAAVSPPKQDSVVSQSATGSISFLPTNEVFVLEIRSRQSGGSLTVTVEEGDMATAKISGNLVDESLLVLPDRLRIQNSSASTTTYEVAVPSSVGRIEVIIANETAVALRPTEEQLAWTIPVNLR